MAQNIRSDVLANAAGYGTDRKRNSAREGAALLQGLAICGRCGRRMSVAYRVRRGHPVPTIPASIVASRKAMGPVSTSLGQASTTPSVSRSLMR